MHHSARLHAVVCAEEWRHVPWWPWSRMGGKQTVPSWVLAGVHAVENSLCVQFWSGFGFSWLRNTNTPPAPLKTAIVTEGAVGLAGRSSAVDNDYTERLEGLFIPPYNATYQFYIGGDDWCDLRLSNDSNPANLTRISLVSSYNEFSTPFWQFASQRSPELALVAGEPYYIRISHEESGKGLDWVRVALRIINPPPHGS
jgi:hypothetical protein